MNKEFDYNVLDEILKEHNYDESHTVTILQEVQAHYSYLPKEAFPYLAEKLGVPEAKIYGVATFYENFSLEPKGTNIIRCCDGTACHVRHSAAKRTTDDLKFTVETVSCLGACGLAPVITVNGKVYSQMTKEKAAEVLKELREEN